jgi:hypothetical protein
MSPPETAERLWAELEQLVDLSDHPRLLQAMEVHNAIGTDCADLSDPRIETVAGPPRLVIHLLHASANDVPPDDVAVEIECSEGHR